MFLIHAVFRLLTPAGLSSLAYPFISPYYVLDQRMPYHILFGKIRKPYTFNILKYLLGFHKARRFCKREVYLCDIPCYHCPRTQSQSCQEHLHLFSCRVLRLIHYNERIIQGPAAHECKGRSEEHTSELQSQSNLVCRLLLEK